MSDNLDHFSKDLVEEYNKVGNSDENLANGDVSGEETEGGRVGEWQDILGSGGIMRKVVKEGVPQSSPGRAGSCRIKYECRLQDGTLVESCDNFIVQIGDCEVSTTYVNI